MSSEEPENYKFESGCFYETIDGISLGGPLRYRGACIVGNLFTPKNKGEYDVYNNLWRAADGGTITNQPINGKGPKSLNPERKFKSLGHWNVVKDREPKESHNGKR